MHIRHFSDEIIEIVISYLPHPTDLLSFALSEKYFYALIIHDHLPFRRFNSDLIDTSEWERLKKNVLLARNVWMLDITGKSINLDKLPARRGFNKQEWEKHAQSHDWTPIQEAIPEMKNLIALRWKPSLSSEIREAVWGGLEEGGLKDKIKAFELEWDYNGLYSGLVNDHFRQCHSMCSFVNLTHVSLSIHVPFGAYVIIEDLVMPLLKRQKNLLALWLSFYDFELGSVLPIFDACTWPQLKHLSLKGSSYTWSMKYESQSTTEKITRFFSRHASTIETLMLPDIGQILRAFHFSFAKLRSLWFSHISGDGDSENLIPSGVAEQLTFLHASPNGDAVLPLEQSFPRLKGLSLSSEADEEFLGLLLKVHPDLEALSFHWEAYVIQTFIESSINRQIDLFSQFQNLTYLAGFLRFEENNAGFLISLATKSRSLKFVEMQRQWVEIGRASDGSYVGYQPMWHVRRAREAVGGGCFTGVELDTLYQ